MSDAIHDSAVRAIMEGSEATREQAEELVRMAEQMGRESGEAVRRLIDCTAQEVRVTVFGTSSITAWDDLSEDERQRWRDGVEVAWDALDDEDDTPGNNQGEQRG